MLWPEEAWPELARGVPNVALRSALFGVSPTRSGERPYLEGALVATPENAAILYTGQRLDQGDLDVWQGVLHLARRAALGDRCQFTAYELLKLTGKADTGGNRHSLHRRLVRLQATSIELTHRVADHTATYSGSLVPEITRDNTTRVYTVVLNPTLRSLFDRSQFTYVDWRIRRELHGKPLAQWLQGNYTSHAKPYPMSVQRLRSLSGSETKSMASFRQTLKKAVLDLQCACAAHGLSIDVELIGDILHVQFRRPIGRASCGN